MWNIKWHTHAVVMQRDVFSWVTTEKLSDPFNNTNPVPKTIATQDRNERNGVVTDGGGRHTNNMQLSRVHFTWESVRASRVTGRNTRQERAHSVEKHRNAFSSGQSFIQMSTVADGLASFSFHQGGKKKGDDGGTNSGNRKERKQIGQYLTVKYKNLQNNCSGRKIK